MDRQDPYSGQPLKLQIRDGEIVIYSIGPDGDEDHAAKHVDVFKPAEERGKDQDGDVVFRLHGFRL